MFRNPSPRAFHPMPSTQFEFECMMEALTSEGIFSWIFYHESGALSACSGLKHTLGICCVGNDTPMVEA